jgi:organic hydroperoxide reductase OsmC/OhrA
MFTKNRYTRGHEWQFDGGIAVPASSSPHSVRTPFSLEAAVDPEEALVASAASCHMLTFLWLAATSGFQIDAYEDNAEGLMEKLPDGRQWMSRITLRPAIEWAGEKTPTRSEIDELHHAAHEQCYIANSLRSEIVVELPKDAGSASA